ncbi:hypothetical protein J2Z66_007820 [Paenibacillus eucommiae]|uniref:Uncharacterized protein n=1 Tax=Paenibacillus eucommiae TaxID=1355755 RepID=A0ABS4JAQ7_9BACL|nr:hypothetical protein [Paenibacillus eucommiae]
MYDNGQELITDLHFQAHMDADIPVQVYYQNKHKDIGYVEYFTPSYIKINNTYYNRYLYTFVSRPGY